MSIIISLNLHRTRNQQTNFAYNPTQYMYMHLFVTPKVLPRHTPVKYGCFIVLLVSRKTEISFCKNSITLIKWTFLPFCKKWCIMLCEVMGKLQLIDFNSISIPKHVTYHLNSTLFGKHIEQMISFTLEI
jgi:hypothetical protein